jgi:hypothetical protein
VLNDSRMCRNPQVGRYRGKKQVKLEVRHHNQHKVGSKMIQLTELSKVGAQGVDKFK